MYSRRFIGSMGLLMVLALVGCGGATTTGTTTGASGNEGTPATLNVEAASGGRLKFQPDALSAPANQPFTVDFKNPAPLEHNWVLVAPGQEQAVVAASASKGGDPTGVSGVIALGTVLKANGEETVSASPSAGTYSYICTVPGHYAGGMKGTLTVK